MTIVAILALIIALANLVALGVVATIEFGSVRRINAKFTRAAEELEAREKTIDSQLEEVAETYAATNAMAWRLEEFQQTLQDFGRREQVLVDQIAAAIGVRIDLEESPR